MRDPAVMVQWYIRNCFHLYLVIWHLTLVARWPNTCGMMGHISHSQSPVRSPINLSLTDLNFSDQTIPR